MSARISLPRPLSSACACAFVFALQTAKPSDFPSLLCFLTPSLALFPTSSPPPLARARTHTRTDRHGLCSHTPLSPSPSFTVSTTALHSTAPFPCQLFKLLLSLLLVWCPALWCLPREPKAVCIPKRIIYRD